MAQLQKTIISFHCKHDKIASQAVLINSTMQAKSEEKNILQWLANQLNTHLPPSKKVE